MKKKVLWEGCRLLFVFLFFILHGYGARKCLPKTKLREVKCEILLTVVSWQAPLHIAMHSLTEVHTIVGHHGIGWGTHQVLIVIQEMVLYLYSWTSLMWTCVTQITHTTNSYLLFPAN